MQRSRHLLRLHAANGAGLLEAVLYIAVVAVVVAAAVNITLAMNASFTAAGTERALARSGTSALGRIAHEVRLAREINTASLFSVNPAILALDTEESVQDDTQAVKIITVSGDRLYIERGSEREYLTAPGTRVTSFQVASTTGASPAPAVRILLRLSAERGRFVRSVTFHHTIVLRGAY